MNLPHLFYVQNLDLVVQEMVALFVFWTALSAVLKGRVRKVVSICAAVLSVLLILFFTLLRRSPSDTAAISLTPLISFQKAHEQDEMYRTMLMNVCLFLPLGLSLPFALSYKSRRPVIFSLLTALLLSVSAEAAQLVFHIGWCETDDVIMNVIGASIGSLSFVIIRGIQKLRSEHVHRSIRR